MLTIDKLTNVPRFENEVMSCIVDNWGDSYEQFYKDDYQNAIRDIMNDECYVLYNKDTYIASVTITDNDLLPVFYGNHKWIANLFVAEGHRGKRIIDVILTYIKTLYNSYYLYCEPELVAMYQKRNFVVVDQMIYNDEKIYVMCWIKKDN